MTRGIWNIEAPRGSYKYGFPRNFRISRPLTGIPRSYLRFEQTSCFREIDRLPKIMFKTIIIAAIMICLSSGCLVVNCPRGGKRSNTLVSIENVVRDCPSCGPNHRGQCFGPNICCGTSIGCFIGTSESYACRKESLYSRPCMAGFSMCRGNTGRCAAEGICCTQESCYVDPACGMSNEAYSDNPRN